MSSIRDRPKLGNISTTTQNSSVLSPIPFKSVKDLQSLLDDTTKTLQTIPITDERWTDRLHALITLQQISLGNSVTQPIFMQSISGPLRIAISKQFSDARSSIIREVCTLLSILATRLGDKIERLQEYWIQDLLKILSSVNSVMRESGNKTILDLLRHCQCNRVLPSITQHLLNQRLSTHVRQYCAYYILIILLAQCLTSPESLQDKKIIDNTSLEKPNQDFPYVHTNLSDNNLNILLQTLIVIPNDSSSEVRLIGRSCIFFLTGEFSIPPIWKSHAKFITGQLSPNVRNTITSEREELNRIIKTTIENVKNNTESKLPTKST